MVDVAGKEATAREAVATGRLVLSAAAVAALRGGTVAKGDALGVARVAGILATKRVPELIPLCHQIALTGAEVELDVTDTHVAITVTARTTDRTGVEMEALTGVAIAGLALHDMIKAIDPAAVLTDVRLERKTGGKSGDWVRP
jgi:cyclic pyranopterin phosphate synthase